MENAWDEIRAWRRQRRAELIAARLALTADEHRARSAELQAQIRAGFVFPVGTVIAFCWPFKKEFDARFALRDFRAAGALATLPVVVAAASPLQFRQWWPGAPMRKGVYDIPHPHETRLLAPDVAFVPMNGFDAQGYRLGYGGGYFDRTLAAQSPRMVAIGLAFENARLPTIQPQAHDIAMDFIVTEAGIYRAQDGELASISAAAATQELRDLFARRSLPRTTAVATAYSSPVCYAAEFPGYFGEQIPVAD